MPSVYSAITLGGKKGGGGADSGVGFFFPL